MRQRNIDFVRPAPERGESRDVFIKLTPQRIPKYKIQRLAPKDEKYLDDDVLSNYERAVYNDTI